MTRTRFRLGRLRLRPRLAALGALLLSLAALDVMGVSDATPALAQTPSNCINPHCYSLSEFNLRGNATYNGVHATIPLTWIESGASSVSTDYHISNEIWMGLSSADNYIEAGVADGYVPPPNTSSCYKVINDPHTQCNDWIYESGSNGSSTCLTSGCGAYFLFWADHHLLNGTVYSYNHVVRFLSPTGGDEFVDILWNWAGDNNWDINFTGAYAYRGASGQDDSAGHHPYDVTMGGELFAPASNTSCADPVTDQMGFWSGPGWTINWPSLESSNNHVDSGFSGGSDNSPRDGDFTWSMPSYHCT